MITSVFILSHFRALSRKRERGRKRPIRTECCHSPHVSGSYLTDVTVKYPELFSPNARLGPQLSNPPSYCHELYSISGLTVAEYRKYNLNEIDLQCLRIWVYRFCCFLLPYLNFNKLKKKNKRSVEICRITSEVS